ncbi:hypothetical protein SKAU_G00265120 [Synaphobranchus kaupii]|uniref:Uncharacterized protein n=1 Tax=Synaphobranchus kaupii TaxID=118154 RepID=A0A9Q1IMY3_SYNKA|nr:hypothetical protein SKAU_G00265120 [Synaphobranchus kaupii]
MAAVASPKWVLHIGGGRRRDVLGMENRHPHSCGRGADFHMRCRLAEPFLGTDQTSEEQQLHDYNILRTSTFHFQSVLM